MDDPFEPTPMNVALEALMRLHATVDYVIELLEEEAGEEEDRRRDESAVGRG